MRNTSGGTWATLVKDGRTRLGISQQRLADAVGVDRTTVWRWENTSVKPETAEMVAAVADALLMDRSEVMQAAGLAIADSTQTDPRLRGLDQNDPVVRKILSFDIDEEMRGYMLDRHRHNLERDRQRYLDDIERDVYIYRGRRDAA